jgi:hypothetical protein
MSTTQNFSGTGGTTYTLQQIAGPPPPQVVSGIPTGNFLRLAAMPTSPIVGNDNSISFVTSDPGTFNQATAAWEFRVTQISGESGVGMSFALLNTANYGTTGGAASVQPSQGIYEGSLAFGFDTTNDIVYLSKNAAIVTAASLTGQLNLASGQFITAQASIDFQTATVSLVLTPMVSGSAVTVFNSITVPGLGPYESRVSYEAQNSSTSFADFDLTNINVVYTGIRLAGTISFSSVSYTVFDNQPTAQIDVVRTGGNAGSFAINFVSADGTARNGVNYEAVAGTIAFGEGVTEQIVNIPILNDHLYDGNKTVKLFIGNPTNIAPIQSPIVATLTIVNTNSPPPTVSPTVQLVYAPQTRRVMAFRLQFSQPMDPTSSQNVNNYQVLLPPAHRGGPKRTVALSQAVLDPSGLFVTLYRSNLSVHLTKFLQIIVRGKPYTGLLSASGTFLAGTGGVSGTDANLVA